ncbi:centrobin [Spea bombifrons]|uniref:centrobin n=1 Tax=Spea bombifrons TaxID=233779 RepID=UPI00234BE8A7|nr:centrobin [Spea bombifrons]
MALPHTFSLRDASLLSGIEPLPLSSPTSPRQGSSLAPSPPPVLFSTSPSTVRRAATSRVTTQLYASLRRSRESEGEEFEEIPEGTETVEELLAKADDMASEVDDLAEETSTRLQEARKEESPYISQMESLRGHLQNMLGFSRIGISHGMSVDKREEDASDCTSSLLNIRPAHNVSPPLSLSGLEALFPHYSTLYNAAPSLPDLQLRDTLERETTRRKHLERHIQNLQNEMLELQQRLSVSMTADRRKDTMIQQLDQTLAVVVGGWKQQEKQKEEAMARLREQREEAEKARLTEQETLIQLQRELSQASGALSREKEMTAEQQRQLQILLEEKTALAGELQAERESAEARHAEDRIELESLRSQMQERQKESEERERALQEECEKWQEEKRREVESERALVQQESQKSQQLQLTLGSLQSEVLQLERELQASRRERDSLQMELNLEKARNESERVRIESEHKVRLEEAITERVSAVHEESAQHMSAVRDQHRRQLLDLTSQHERELSSQLSQFKSELQERERRHRDILMDYELKLSHSEDRSRELSVTLRRLESERAEMLTQLQEVMKSHWSQALRVLNAKSFPDTSAASLQTTEQRASEKERCVFPPQECGHQEEMREKDVHGVETICHFTDGTGQLGESASSRVMHGNQLQSSNRQHMLDGGHLEQSRNQVLKENHDNQQTVVSSQINDSLSLHLGERSPLMESKSQHLVPSSHLKETSFQFMGDGGLLGNRSMLGSSGSGQQVIFRSQPPVDSMLFKDNMSQISVGDGRTMTSRDTSSQSISSSHFKEPCSQSMTDGRQPMVTGDIFGNNLLKRELIHPTHPTEGSDVESSAGRHFMNYSGLSMASGSHISNQPAIAANTSGQASVSGSRTKENDDQSSMTSSFLNKMSHIRNFGPQIDVGFRQAPRHNPQPVSKEPRQDLSWQPRNPGGYQEGPSHLLSHRATDQEESFYPLQMEELSESFSSHFGFYPLEPHPDGSTTGKGSQISPERPFQEEALQNFRRSDAETAQSARAGGEQGASNPLLQYYIRMLLDRTPGEAFSEDLEKDGSSNTNPDMAEMSQYAESRAGQPQRSDEKEKGSLRRKPDTRVPSAVTKEVLSSQRRPAQTKVLKRVPARGGRSGVWR